MAEFQVSRSSLVSVACGVVCVLALAPAAAEAASRAAKNRCNDAIGILRSGPSKFYEREEVDPLDTKNAVTHRKQVTDGFRMARAKLDQVPAAELDDKDPELKECFDEVRAWEAYMKRLDDKIKIAEEQGKVFVPFLATVAPQEDSFTSFLSIAYDPTTGAFDNAKPSDARRALDELAIVEKACAGIPAEYRIPPKDYDPKMKPATLMKRPFAWCRTASNRVPLITAYLANRSFSAEGYGNYVLLVPETIEGLVSGKGYMDAWMADIVLDSSRFKTSLKKSADEWYKAIGIAMPADPFTAIDALITKLKARVDEVAPTLKFETGPKAPAIESGAKTALLKIYPKAKVVKSAMDAADFEIRKTGAGIPTERFRSGQIMFKVPGSAHCMQRTFSYVETYKGGGKYQKPSAVNILGATRFLSCS